MRAYLVFILVSIPAIILCQPQWHAQSSPVNETLLTVSFADTSNGWAISSAGTLIHTVNGGKEWDIQTTVSDLVPEKIQFLNTQAGWLAGYVMEGPFLKNSLIIKSEDGGATWINKFDLAGSMLADIFFLNDTLGWAVGYYLEEGDTLGLRLHTVNGGETWTYQQLGINVATIYASIHFRDPNRGDLCGPGPVLMHTSTGGRTIPGWALDIKKLEQPMYDLANSGDLYGCMVGAEGKILFTKDQWTNFFLDYDYTGGDTLWAVDSYEGPGFVICGEAGTLLHIGYNQFLGAVVQDNSQAITQNLYDVEVLDASHFWAVGEEGTILHFGIPGVSGTGNVPHNRCSLYPNPAKNQTVLTRQSSLPEQINIYSMQGKRVFSLNAEAGLTSIPISLEPLESGYYIIQAGSDRAFLVVHR